MKRKIDFDFINQKLALGFKLRLDIGLSRNMPNALNWLQTYNDVFVIGIEPHPDNFTSCENYLNNSTFKDRCYLIESAIDNVPSPTKKIFYGLGGPETNYDAGTSSLKRPIGRFSNSVDEVYNVDVISLSYILDHINYTFIDLLKTDTQGNDLNVLESLNQHIEKVIDVYAEYDESADYQDANTGEELDNFFLENNFEKYDSIIQPSRNNKIEDCRYKNNLFKTYSYVNGSSILVSKKSEQGNPYTWENNSIYEIDLIEKFASYIQDDFTILDIGSQSGCFSLLAKLYPKTKWHLFEPDKKNYSFLLENLQLNFINNVQLYTEALSDKVEERTLSVCAFNRGLNTIGENLLRFSKDQAFEYIVNTTTIDNLFLDTQIDLIKIDTEGSEYDIIMGGLETIKKYKPKILLEYYDDNLRQCGKSLTELNDLIEQIGYQIIWTYDSNIFIQFKENK